VINIITKVLKPTKSCLLSSKRFYGESFFIACF